MAKGICVFVEHFAGAIDPVVQELLSAARVVAKSTGEPVQALVAGEKAAGLVELLKPMAFDEIYAVDTGRELTFQDDALSTVLAEMIHRVAPSSVLIPASAIGKSVFSRVAAKLGCGLTADCTSLVVSQRENGSYYIEQHKPSFGDNVMVSIITKEAFFPQMMTIRQGVYAPYEEAATADTHVRFWDDIGIPDSRIQVIEKCPREAHGDSIMGAEVVVVGGRGALEEENLALMQKFAAQIGASIGGTRPLADTGVIPFENQIGQTGCTIRPKICLSFGVSGAIQHTEGIKDTKLYIAVNQDADAPIFNTCDYGVTADMAELLRELTAENE